MEFDGEATWSVLLAAARSAPRPSPIGDPNPIVVWQPGVGWKTTLDRSDPRRSFLELYLPICSATPACPVTVGHIGQSLDGFIATHSGESRWVTGEENMRHMHRLRALCDAVIVGAGTVAADDPQLTTRLVEGPNPIRVVLDPARRLSADHRVFNDASAETLYVCAQSMACEGERQFGLATLLPVKDHPDSGVDLAVVVERLRARGCARIFVEGGGVTVSLFLQAKLLDRLHIAIAPLLIGDGRPAIRLEPPDALDDCHRPRHRVFRMGPDVLFDCDLAANADADDDGRESTISRVI
jgi:riboflavin-specific deaminase-like protein